LLREAEVGFAAFVTSDKRIKYQQTVTGRQIAILVLPSNDWPTLRAMQDKIAAAVDKLMPGDFVEL
jgi:hypothetical protein